MILQYLSRVFQFVILEGLHHQFTFHTLIAQFFGDAVNKGGQDGQTIVHGPEKRNYRLSVTAFAQPLGALVRAVADLTGGLPDTLTGSGRNLPLFTFTAQNDGYGCCGHPCLLGNIFNGRHGFTSLCLLILMIKGKQVIVNWFVYRLTSFILRKKVSLRHFCAGG